MKLGGFMKMTLLDFPGRVACTVFTLGCNWRCPFCHNAGLATGHGDAIDEEELFAFLKKRQGILDGVAITGGEPTLWQDLGAFIEKIRALGYAVKLDTNGTNPEMLRRLCEDGLLDMVAMDIKNAPQRYAKTCGVQDCSFEKIRQSAEFLMEGKVPFEFRTTVVRGLHDEEAFRKIGEWLRGPWAYYLQAFQDSGELMQSGMQGFEKAQMQRFLEAVKPYLPRAEIRGE